FELALPHAVIRFKQGFGRLIRSTKDRGIVFICDARVIKARYGHFFMKSIPEMPHHYASTYELIKKVESGFKKGLRNKTIAKQGRGWEVIGIVKITLKLLITDE